MNRRKLTKMLSIALHILAMAPQTLAIVQATIDAFNKAPTAIEKTSAIITGLEGVLAELKQLT